MISRIDQQIRVNKMMMAVTPLSKVENKKQRKYMRNFLEIVTCVSSILCVKSGTEENLAKKKQLWADMKAEHPELYKILRYRPLGICLHLPGKIGRKIMIWGYTVAQKIFGFN